MKKIIITVFAGLLFIISCKKNVVTTETSNKTKEVIAEKTFAEKIEIAHNKNNFLKQEAIQFDALIEFGGNEIFNANITISTTSDIAKIAYKNGDFMYVDKQNVFVSPSLKDNSGVRFHAYTWSYFFLYPYKLSDHGTKWDDNFKTSEANNSFNTAKLSFEANTGDAPDDWYIVYTNKDNNMLDHVAYIVTAGKTKAEAEADPHAIKYLDYKQIDGVPFATNWEFLEWGLEKGLTKKIGSGKITNIKFVTGFRNSFTIPKDFIKK
ncbi:hypothetical protein BW723_13240 [Polaribacter reichenbachii]|nr:hypothetical protein [Polaribacter reichenbachii]APZ48160.1 hypothetical protein BW723_13240 [Polaribacter reichenbachii]AUC20429.1 hypothetical protein BTO17_03685 [Polaribacter reichenbachii]